MEWRTTITDAAAQSPGAARALADLAARVFPHAPSRGAAGLLLTMYAAVVLIPQGNVSCDKTSSSASSGREPPPQTGKGVRCTRKGEVAGPR